MEEIEDLVAESTDGAEGKDDGQSICGTSGDAELLPVEILNLVYTDKSVAC